MVEDASSFDESRVVRIEPGDRIVLLTRTMHAREPGLEPACGEAVDLFLNPMLTIPRWTFNEAVMETDLGVGQLGLAKRAFD